MTGEVNGPRGAEAHFRRLRRIAAPKPFLFESREACSYSERPSSPESHLNASDLIGSSTTMALVRLHLAHSKTGVSWWFGAAEAVIRVIRALHCLQRGHSIGIRGGGDEDMAALR